jgi:hypothetical protein
MELDNKFIEKEDKFISETPIEELKQEEQTQNNVNSAELVQYVSFLHNIVFEKLLKMEIKPELLDELNKSGSELLGKYMPKADILGKYSAEISYITVISLIVMQNNKKTKSVEYKKEDKNDTN